MDIMFFLIRLPFFLIGAFLLLAIQVIILCIAIGLAPLVLPLAGAGWILMLVLVFIYAAFTNSSDAIASFLNETEKWINALWEEYVIGFVVEYPKMYVHLFKWLVGKTNVTK